MSVKLPSLGLLLALALWLQGCDGDARHRGSESLRIGDYDRAIIAWNSVLDVKPADREARYGLALSWFTKARDEEHMRESSDTSYEQAAHEFRILVNLDTTKTVRTMASSSLFQVARISVEADHFEDALRVLNESIQLDSLNWFAWNLKGLVLEGLGKPDAAQTNYEHIISQAPDFVTAYINLGNLHWSQRKFGEAWDDWSLGLDRDSSNTYLKYWVGRAEVKLKEEALKD